MATPSTTRDIIVGLILLVGLALGIGWGVGLWLWGTPEPAVSANSDTARRNLQAHLWILCRYAVEPRLKAPASAQWPWMAKEVAITPDRTSAVVIAHVDAQNSFGALMRTDILCTLKRAGDQWSVSDVATQSR